MKRGFFILAIFLVLFISFFIIGNTLPGGIVISMDKAGIVFGYLLSCISVSAAIYAYYNRSRIRRWFLRNDFENLGEEFTVPQRQIEAIVIPVSRKEQPEWILRWLKPKKVALLYTERSKSDALDLTRDFSGEIEFLISEQDIQSDRYLLDDPFNPEKCYLLAKKFINLFLNDSIPSEQIFVDATGGTVPMSIGCFQAAEEMGVSSIYVIGTDNGFIKKPGLKEQGNPIFLSDRTKK